MPDVDKLYNWLLANGGPDADAILGTALKHAEAEYVKRLATLLLARKTDAAWAALVAEYDRLPAEMHAALKAQPQLLRAGVAVALRTEEPGARRGPLHLLTEQPQPQLLPLVAEALRDPTTEIKAAAAAVIRRGAEAALAAGPSSAGAGSGDAQEPSSAPDGDANSRGSAEERAGVVIGLREALRTFDAHFRLEVLEACLWFARDLGDVLWNAIDTRRSHAAYAITEHLEAWNSPRLAGFLLMALARPTWRRTAHAILDGWRTRDELLAILGNSDLLENPGVRDGLRQLKCPRWLAAAGPRLADLPPSARACLPRWICCLGFPEEERVRCLASWLHLPQPEVQRAAVYALAELGNNAALRILADVARRPGPLAQFARWFLAGKCAGGEHTGSLARSRGQPERTECRHG